MILRRISQRFALEFSSLLNRVISYEITHCLILMVGSRMSSLSSSLSLLFSPTCVLMVLECRILRRGIVDTLRNSPNSVRQCILSHSLSPLSERNSEFGKRVIGLWPVKSSMEMPSAFPTCKVQHCRAEKCNFD